MRSFDLGDSEEAISAGLGFGVLTLKILICED